MVPSVVVLIVILLERLVNLGRSGHWGIKWAGGTFSSYLITHNSSERNYYGAESGSWWDKRDAGEFSCPLSILPSLTHTHHGAYMVTGSTCKMSVPSIVIYTFIHLGYGLPMGRRVVHGEINRLPVPSTLF